MPIKPQQHSILVSKDGSNIYALRNDGVVLSYGTTVTTVIQAALNGLTSGRTWKETVKIVGDFTISQLIIPSYTTLDLRECKLFQANSTNDNMIENSDSTNGNTDIEFIGGLIDGNRANQTGGGGAETTSLLWFKKCSNVNIHDGFWTHANYHCFRLLDCPTNIRITNNRIENWKQEGVCDHATGELNGVCHDHIVANNYFAHHRNDPGAEGAYGTATGSCAISTWNVNDYVFNGNTVKNICAGSSTTFNGLRQIVTSNVITDGAGGDGVLGTGTTSTGIALSQTVADTGRVSYSVIANNVVKNMGKACIHVQNSTESQDVIVANNYCDGTNDATANGIVIQDCDNILVVGNIVRNCAAAGIAINGNLAGDLTAIRNGVIANNICYNNAQSVSANDYRRAGIAVYTTNGGAVENIMVQGNRCYDDQGTQTQKYGVYFLSTTNCIAKHNDVRGNLTAGIGSLTNTTLKIFGNEGYTTEASGTSATQNGTGSQTVFNIAHGLAAAPTFADARATLSEAIGNFWITKDATNVIINYAVPPQSGTNNLQWTWEAAI